MKIIYHDDMDGICSASLAMHSDEVKTLGKPDLIPIDRDVPFPWNALISGEKVYLLDYSLQPWSEMEKLAKMVDLVWIDHHRSAMIEYGEQIEKIRAEVVLDLKGLNNNTRRKAACELCWYHFYGNKGYGDIPDAVHYIGRYDVWDHNCPEICKFQLGILAEKDLRDPSHTGWRVLFDPGFASRKVDELITGGQFIQSYLKQEQDSWAKKACFEFEWWIPAYGTYTCIGLCGGHNGSWDFGQEYNPARHHMMVSFTRLSGAWKVSLRSTRKDVDVSKIASKFGGGGHKGAAGFRCDALPFSLTPTGDQSE